MKTIKFNSSIGVYNAGECASLSEEVASKLIQEGLATEVEKPKKPKQVEEKF